MTYVAAPVSLGDEGLAEVMRAIERLDPPEVPRPGGFGPSSTCRLSTDGLRPLLEHTLLTSTATLSDIDRLCDEAVEHRLGAVCVNPVWVRRAATRLEGRGVRVVTVIGFPLGVAPTRAKVSEAKVALADGADELDMVANLAALRLGDCLAAYEDIRATVEVAQLVPVKVIIEAGLLERREKILASAVAVRAGASFVKTSTGLAFAERGGGMYAPLGATVEDVALIRAVVGDAVGVKAAGGIKTAEQAKSFVAAGASRVGTSASLRIIGAT